MSTRWERAYRKKWVGVVLLAVVAFGVYQWIYVGETSNKAPFAPENVVDYVHRPQIHAVYRRADSLKYQLDYAAAVQVYERILSDNNTGDENRYYGINQLTWLYLMTGNDSAAIGRMQQMNDTSGLLAGNGGADFRFNKGLLAFHAGDWQGALFHFKKSVAAFADLYGSDHLRYAQCLNQIGLVYISQSDNPEAAKEYIQEAGRFFDRHPELESFRIENYLAKALIAVIDRDYKRGRDICNLALERFSTLAYQNKLLKAKILCVKGDHLKHLQRTAQSDTLLQEALKLVRAQGYSFEAGDLFRTTAFLLTDLSGPSPQYPEGLDSFFRHAPLQRGYPDWVKGFAWYYKGQVDSTIFYLEQFLQNNRSTDARTLDAVYYVLCEEYATKGNYQKSLDFAYKDLQIGTDSSHLNFVVYGLIGRVYLQKYRKSGSVSDLLKAELNFAKVDSLFFPSLLAFSEEAILGFQQQVGDDCFPQAVETTFLLYQKTGAKQWLDKAFRYGERQKSMLMYRDMLNRHASEPSYFIWADSARKVAAKVNRLQFLKDTQRNWTAASQRELESAISVLEQVNRNRHSTAEEYNRTIRQPISTIAAVQAALEEKEVLLTYCFGKKNLYALCIPQSGKVGFVQTGNTDELKKRLQRYHVALKNYRQEIPRDSTDALSAALLQPFEALLRGKEEILVVPDRELYLLPFEVLYWQKKPAAATTARQETPRLVVDDFAVAYTPSWKVHLTHRKDAKQPFHPKRIGIWADASLPHRAAAIGAVFRAFATTSSIDTFNGSRCTKSRFLREQANYDVLHLFMHGKSNLSDRRDNKLAFGTAQDTLWGFEVQAENFRARLAVLSACETALGAHETGEGAFTLSRSFLQAGIPQVVATLWEVQEAKTTQIIGDFYQRLGQNVPPVKALQQAKSEYRRRAQGFWKHPAFWAGAVVME